MSERDIFLKVPGVSPEELTNLHSLLQKPHTPILGWTWFIAGVQLLSAKWEPTTKKHDNDKLTHGGSYTIEIKLPVAKKFGPGLQDRALPDAVFEALGIFSKP